MDPTESLSDDELGRLVARAAELPDAPPELVRAAQALFTASKAECARISDVARAALRLVQAVLRFDSAAQTAVALGMRSVGDSTSPRHLLYSAGGRDIDLRVHAGERHFALSGQVLGPDEEGTVELWPAGVAAGAPVQERVTALDEMGEFRFDDVPSGAWRIALCVGGDRIELPPIEAGGP